MLATKHTARAVIAFFVIPDLKAKNKNEIHAIKARRPVAFPMTSLAD